MNAGSVTIGVELAGGPGVPASTVPTPGPAPGSGSAPDPAPHGALRRIGRNGRRRHGRPGEHARVGAGRPARRRRRARRLGDRIGCRPSGCRPLRRVRLSRFRHRRSHRLAALARRAVPPRYDGRRSRANQRCSPIRPATPRRPGSMRRDGGGRCPAGSSTQRGLRRHSAFAAATDLMTVRARPDSDKGDRCHESPLRRRLASRPADARRRITLGPVRRSRRRRNRAADREVVAHADTRPRRLRQGAQRRRGPGAAGAARPRGPADRRRAQPDPDDAAADRPARTRHRHQRPHRAGLHPRRPSATGGHALPGHRRDDPAPIDPGVRGDRRALPDPARRRARHRRPDRPQPRHGRRVAVPGRPGRGPVRGRRGAAGRPGPALGRRIAQSCRPGSSPTARTRPCSTTPRCSSRCGFPIRPGAGSAYEKVERRAGDWAVAAAGAFVVLDGDTVTDVGIGLAARRRRPRLRPGGRGATCAAGR